MSYTGRLADSFGNSQMLLLVENNVSSLLKNQLKKVGTSSFINFTYIKLRRILLFYSNRRYIISQ